ncbi:hypothetical protein Pedsa_1143 [Pseudopedobacter saltans DSM 12145]|uniref:Uncharacterized protein n=1 Tax=Pseudopedobacter saltans (strain ATCC 51119 / DSM 12145 / JCM 21818 / CCUG 39354 / LMG 10337 / NBRC 100064 / NCIMB 13643) TaxID=762903 RepID=F0SCB5_PSESL|nr:hypothetical protein [Pseudopedobacter saltans]ADY51712.1 hypothetical protein Pedsa_1143 [Pseudopedobacter saltans DSM 12145]
MKITLEDSALALNLTIIELSETTLKYSGKHPFYDNLTVVFTFTAQ